MARWEETGVYRFTAPAAPTSTRSTRRRRPSAARCTSGTSSRTPTPTSSRASSACAARPCSIRWDGTTTACRPNAACRTTTACAAIRRCRTIRLRQPPGAAAASSRSPVSRPNFIELCERLTNEDEKAFEQLWRHLGLSVDWAMTYATIGRRVAARVAAGVPATCCERGLAYQLEAPTLWDVDFRTAVAQAELEDRERAARTTACDSIRARRRRRSRSRRRVPSCCPPAWRSSRIRTTSATSRCSADTCVTPLFGVERAGPARTRSPIPKRAAASR